VYAEYRIVDGRLMFYILKTLMILCRLEKTMCLAAVYGFDRHWCINFSAVTVRP